MYKLLVFIKSSISFIIWLRRRIAHRRKPSVLILQRQHCKFKFKENSIAYKELEHCYFKFARVGLPSLSMVLSLRLFRGSTQTKVLKGPPIGLLRGQCPSACERSVFQLQKTSHGIWCHGHTYLWRLRWTRNIL